MYDLSVSTSVVRAVVKNFVAAGGEVDGVLRLSGIAPELLTNATSRVSASNFSSLIVNVSTQMGDEGLGYSGLRYQLGTWEFMCRSVISSGSLEGALERYCRYFSLFPESLQINYEVEESTVSVSFLNPDDKMDIEFFAYLEAMLKFHRFLGWLVGMHLPLLEVRFGLPQPGFYPELKPMFQGIESFFSEKETGLVFPQKLLSAPVTQTELTLNEYLRNPILAMVLQEYAEYSWSQRVRGLLGLSPDGVPELSQIAMQLNIHQQTLRRRLKQEGTNFSRIKAQYKRDAAIDLLMNKRLSVEETSEKMGFSESSSFIRAFKSWVGVTPFAYKKGIN